MARLAMRQPDDQGQRQATGGVQLRFGKTAESLYTLGGFDKLGVETRIMVKIVTVNADIPASRELRITLPADVPIGRAAIMITVSPTGTSASATFGDLLNSEFLGMWRDRADIVDSLEFARKLRSESWNKSAP